MKRKIIVVLTSISFLLLTTSQNVLAKEAHYDNYIRVINNNTQKEVDIEIKEINTEITTNFLSTKSTFLTSNTSDSFTKEVQIKFDIPELDGIRPFAYDDTSKNYSSFVAYLRYDYQRGGTTALPKIKVTSVQGSWKCTSTSYTARFENRDLLAKQGNWFYDSKCTLVKQPTSNTFKYSTGWGFVDDLPKTAYSGVYVVSTAKAVINGMSGGYTLETKLSS